MKGDLKAMNSRQAILDSARVVTSSGVVETQNLVQHTLTQDSYKRLEEAFPPRNPVDAVDAARLYGQQQVLAWVRSKLTSQ